MNSKTLYQAVLLGVVTVLIGLVLSVVFSSLKPDLPTSCEEWDKYYVMEVMLFFTGVLIRLLLTTEMGRKYLLAGHVVSTVPTEN
jgi:hypothetical protein